MKHICLAGPVSTVDRMIVAMTAIRAVGVMTSAWPDELPEECTVRRATARRTIEYMGYDIFCEPLQQPRFLR